MAVLKSNVMENSAGTRFLSVGYVFRDAETRKWSREVNIDVDCPAHLKRPFSTTEVATLKDALAVALTPDAVVNKCAPPDLLKFFNAVPKHCPCGVAFADETQQFRASVHFALAEEKWVRRCYYYLSYYCYNPACDAESADDHARTFKNLKAKEGKAGTNDVSFIYDCATCGKSSEKMYKCSKCKLVRYCDRDCQLADWKRHKSECKNRGRDLTFEPPPNGNDYTRDDDGAAGEESAA